MPRTPAEAMLIGVNILPVIGVTCLGWSVVEAMLVYWMENVIIGVMNVFKMLLVAIHSRQLGAIFVIPFFILHYGIFASVHGVFVFGSAHMTRDGKFNMTPEEAFNTFDLQSMGIAVAALTLSHFFSFVWNFVIGKEYQRVTLNHLLGAPYGRVMILHISLLFGMFLIFATGHNAAVLVLLTLFKIFADLALHRRSHEKLAEVEKQA